MLNFLFPESITSSTIVRIMAAALLGGVIGLERDIHGRAAGLRTHFLVSMGSALFMIISVAMAEVNGSRIAEEALKADPGRIAAQIVTGIGFIGAGAILKEGFTIRGLTTAACLWVAAGIGMAAGAGFFEVAILVTLLALAALVFLNRVERIYLRDSYRFLEIQTPIDTDISEVIELVKRKNTDILYCDYERDYQNSIMNIRFTLRLFHRGVTDKLSHAIIDDLEKSHFPLKLVKWSHQ